MAQVTNEVTKMRSFVVPRSVPPDPDNSHSRVAIPNLKLTAHARIHCLNRSNPRFHLQNFHIRLFQFACPASRPPWFVTYVAMEQSSKRARKTDIVRKRTGCQNCRTKRRKVHWL